MDVNKKFRITTKIPVPMRHATGGKGQSVTLPIGTYECERIPCPTEHMNCYWLVQTGTHLGLSESAWRLWEEKEGVTIEEIDD